MITAILARNEADRYLRRVVRHHRKWGRVLVLDDGSEDDTAAVAEAEGAEVRYRGATPMWGQEAPARRMLWDWAADEARDGWVLIADADHLLMGDPRPLCTSWQVNTWCFPLYDCWDEETTYRADGFWQGYRTHRPWLFRPAAAPKGWTAEWSTRGIHCGHAPSNWPMIAANAPEDAYLLHLGWLRREDRLIKYERYRSTWDQLTPWERGHVTSIVDA